MNEVEIAQALFSQLTIEEKKEIIDSIISLLSERESASAHPQLAG